MKKLALICALVGVAVVLVAAFVPLWCLLVAVALGIAWVFRAEILIFAASMTAKTLPPAPGESTKPTAPRLVTDEPTKLGHE